jgi:response regulator of citrate/malate metabolism
VVKREFESRIAKMENIQDVDQENLKQLTVLKVKMDKMKQELSLEVERLEALNTIMQAIIENE